MGILVKGGDVLEACTKVRAVLLDKTGTLTTGVPRIPRHALQLCPVEDKLSSAPTARSPLVR